MRRPRLSCVLMLTLTLAVSVSMTSCSGGDGDGNQDLVLVGTNLPGIAGIALNQPLILTFSALVDPFSITPDTLRVVGAQGPFFETTVVDRNLVALLPAIANFENYSDSGYAPGVEYTVSFAVFPAPSTIRTPDGKPLIQAFSSSFTTLPFPGFIETRRPINHGLPPSLGGTSDDEGCLQNVGNLLFQPPGIVQTGTGPGATLLCLQNEGQPRIIEPESEPRHDAINVGTPSAVNPSFIDLPALRVRGNEAFDPLTTAPYTPTTQLGTNVQLWHVANKDGSPVAGGPQQVETNKPLIVQSLALGTQVILVPSRAVPQGIYMINITGNVTDMAGLPLRIDDRPDPAPGGYDVYEAAPAFQLAVPAGYRIYFKTLELPGTAQAIDESFSSNAREWGNDTVASTGVQEDGLYTSTLPDPTPLPAGTYDGDPDLPFPLGPTPAFTLQDTNALCGQSTTANWNGGNRFLNLPNLQLNPDASGGGGELKAVWRPYCGSGNDGIFDSNLPPNNPGPGDDILIDSDATSIDGILEYDSFNLRPGDKMTVSGSKPLLILVRGDFCCEGEIVLDGGDGGPGLNTDGTSLYNNAGATRTSGIGGIPGPGGSPGGDGGDPSLTFTAGGTGNPASTPIGLFGPYLSTITPITAAAQSFCCPGIEGGGGGGFGEAGTSATEQGGVPPNGGLGNGGPVFGDPLFLREIALFIPDRIYVPNANICGGNGGTGGAADDDLAANADDDIGNLGSQDGGDGTISLASADDGGGGGGGGGGALWVICCGEVRIKAGGYIHANGGNGGNTYGAADQILDLGDDGELGGGDDFVVGANTAAAPSGDGGPGGGGSGGAIFLVGGTGCIVDAGGRLECLGGTGGGALDPTLTGGNGGKGRVLLMNLAGGPAPVDNSNPNDVDPSAVTGTFVPTVDTASVGTSIWLDLFTPTADFFPAGPNAPFFNTNFNFLNLNGGAGLFSATLEFQGANDFLPLPPGGPLSPASSDGLTAWVGIAGIDAIDMKRFVRFRWRFSVDPAFPGFGLTALPMPTILDVTIPYQN